MPCKQEHTGLLSATLHSALAPQGDGTHGLVITGFSSAQRKMKNLDPFEDKDCKFMRMAKSLYLCRFGEKP